MDDQPVETKPQGIKAHAPQVYAALRTVKRLFVRPQPHTFGEPPSPVDAATQQAGEEFIRRVQAIERQVAAQEAQTPPQGRPIVFVVATAHTKLRDFGINAAVALLGAWSVRLAGHKVVYHLCKRGMSQCVTGSNRNGEFAPPPCDTCVAFKNEIYPAQHGRALVIDAPKAQRLRAELEALPWPDVMNYTRNGLALGQLCLPSLIWVERRFGLQPEPWTRHQLTEYIVSAAFLADETAQMIDELQPLALVVSNGTHYPEATMRWVALDRGVRVVSYDVGFRTPTAVFSHGVASEYPIHVPPDFVMGPVENAELDAYLSQRFKGNFTMSARRIWDEMKSLPPELLEKAKHYRQVVPVFTNVAWDTSQAYTNRFFGSMFEWLDATLRQAQASPDTLFVVRAHPDERRSGTPTKEPIRAWAQEHGYADLPNVVLIGPDQPISSYELMALSKFCLVYNSTVGMEAAMLGKLVLPGGWTRYRQAEACDDITSKEDYQAKLRALLESDEPPVVPPEWQSNARRFFYFSLFNASLDFGDLLEPIALPQYVLKDIDADALRPERSRTMRIVVDGIVDGKEFYDLPEPAATRSEPAARF